jgi:hypothetical protein
MDAACGSKGSKRTVRRSFAPEGGFLDLDGKHEFVFKQNSHERASLLQRNAIKSFSEDLRSRAVRIVFHAAYLRVAVFRRWLSQDRALHPSYDRLKEAVDSQRFLDAATWRLINHPYFVIDAPRS